MHREWEFRSRGAARGPVHTRNSHWLRERDESTTNEGGRRTNRENGSHLEFGNREKTTEPDIELGQGCGEGGMARDSGKLPRPRCKLSPNLPSFQIWTYKWQPSCGLVTHGRIYSRFKSCSWRSHEPIGTNNRRWCRRKSSSV